MTVGTPPRTEALAVREATLRDAGALAALVTQLGYPTREEDMAGRLVDLLADRSYCAFVAERDAAVLGLGGGSLGRYFERNGIYARLVVLVVSDASRGLGVGAALVEAVAQWARARGARELFVNSGSHRHEAHRFYERCGFRITGVRLAKELSPAG